MESWKAMESASSGLRKVVAHDLRVSPTLVDHWCHDPIDGDGELNPFQRTAQIVACLRANDAPDAETPVRWLLDELGYIGIRVSDLEDAVSLSGVAAFLRETGEFIEASAAASSDGTITPDERMRIRHELGDVAIQVGTMLAELDREIAGHDLSTLRERIGPKRSRASLVTYYEQRAGGAA